LSTETWLDPAHIQAMVDFLRLRTLKAVRSFCGMANWTALHLPSFAAAIEPLFEMRGMTIARA